MSEERLLAALREHKEVRTGPWDETKRYDWESHCKADGWFAYRDTEDAVHDAWLEHVQHVAAVAPAQGTVGALPQIGERQPGATLHMETVHADDGTVLGYVSYGVAPSGKVRGIVTADFAIGQQAGEWVERVATSALPAAVVALLNDLYEYMAYTTMDVQDMRTIQRRIKATLADQGGAEEASGG